MKDFKKEVGELFYEGRQDYGEESEDAFEASHNAHRSSYIEDHKQAAAANSVAARQHKAALGGVRKGSALEGLHKLMGEHHEKLSKFHLNYK